MNYGVITNGCTIPEVEDFSCCEARRTKGQCGHFQCEFYEESTHGQKCVNIILYGGGNGSVDTAVCDMGEDCLKKCLFSWRSSGKNTVKRKRFFVGRTYALWLSKAN